MHCYRLAQHCSAWPSANGRSTLLFPCHHHAHAKPSHAMPCRPVTSPVRKTWVTSCSRRRALHAGCSVSALGWAFAASGCSAMPPCMPVAIARHAFALPACIGWFPGTCSVQGMLQPKLCVQTSTVRRQGEQGVTHAYLAAQWLSRH